MATTITASATNAGRRALCATATGRLWQATQVSTTIQMWYSDDGGATWTQNTTADFTTGTTASWSLFIDQDDHAHIAYAHPAAYEAYYRRMPSIDSATSWSTQHLIEGDSYYFALLGLVMDRHGPGWAG